MDDKPQPADAAATAAADLWNEHVGPAEAVWILGDGSDRRIAWTAGEAYVEHHQPVVRIRDNPAAKSSKPVPLTRCRPRANEALDSPASPIYPRDNAMATDPPTPSKVIFYDPSAGTFYTAERIEGSAVFETLRHQPVDRLLVWALFVTSALAWALEQDDATAQHRFAANRAWREVDEVRKILGAEAEVVPA